MIFELINEAETFQDTLSDTQDNLQDTLQDALRDTLHSVLGDTPQEDRHNLHTTYENAEDITAKSTASRIQTELSDIPAKEEPDDDSTTQTVDTKKIGDRYFRLKKYDKAVERYSTLIELQPSHFLYFHR